MCAFSPKETRNFSVTPNYIHLYRIELVWSHKPMSTFVYSLDELQFQMLKINKCHTMKLYVLGRQGQTPGEYTSRHNFIQNFRSISKLLRHININIFGFFFKNERKNNKQCTLRRKKSLK